MIKYQVKISNLNFKIAKVKVITKKHEIQNLERSNHIFIKLILVIFKVLKKLKIVKIKRNNYL